MPVTLSMDERLGWLGVLVAFAGPLFVMVGTLFLTTAMGATEAIAGLVALVALVPYFFILFSAREYFNQVVRFSVLKKGPS
jgi:hypothetical protein